MILSTEKEKKHYIPSISLKMALNYVKKRMILK